MTPSSSLPSWLPALKKAVGASILSTDAESLQIHGGDAWFAHALPQVVASPRTTEEVSRLLKFASKHRIPVTPRGAGRGYVGGCVPVHHGISLSLSRMNKIKEVSLADSVAVVQPGVITVDLKKAAEAKGLYYPPDPASFKESSIGGNIATNAGGPRCLKYGVTRNYVLGLEVVLASGEIVRTGSRTHKNKMGFDLVGIFVGSEGMLGVVTEATLRLIPSPKARAAAVATFKDGKGAAAAVSRIQQAGFLPSALEVADALTLRAARAYTSNVPEGNAFLLVEIDGQPPAVRAELKLLHSVLSGCQPVELHVAPNDAACEKLWQMRREFSYSLKATGLTKLNEDVTVPRGRLLDLFHFAEKLEKKFKLQVACFGHAGDGNIHVNLMVVPERANSKEAIQALDALFAQVVAWGGVITGEHGVGLAKKRWWPTSTSPQLRDLHQTMKKALDPLGILNPGKFLG
jgi:glycolate oxidase subunit GlcD